jgi:hypothetical protein
MLFLGWKGEFRREGQSPLSYSLPLEIQIISEQPE